MTLYVANRDPEEEIERAFRLFDTSGLGKIRLEDLKRVAQDLDAHLSDAELYVLLCLAHSVPL